MAISPGELPFSEMDFGAPREYDPVRIAEEVMWPLVDLVYWKDWRQESHCPNEWHVTKRGNWQGEILDVTLNAFKDPRILDFDEEPGDEEEPSMSTVVFEIETILYDQRRDIILGMAAEDDEEIAAALERYNDEDQPEVNDDQEADDNDADDEQDEDEERELDIEDFTAKINFSYKFYSDGEHAVLSGKVVEDEEAFVIWIREEVPEAEEPVEMKKINEDDPTTIILGQVIAPSIYDHNMDMIEAGLHVFGAPEFIIKAFNSVRESPKVY